jgi:hypothetical protein
MTPDEARLRQLWGIQDEPEETLIDRMAAQFVADVESYLAKVAEFQRRYGA